MAVLPSVKSIRREDLGKDVPEWVDGILSPLTSFMESVYSALNRQITYSENINCSIREITFQTASDYVASDTFDAVTFPSGIRSKPVGCWILQISNVTSSAIIKEPVAIQWEEISGTVRVNYISGLADSIKYIVRIIII